MTNYERYSVRIVDIISKGGEIALKDGIPYECDAMSCNECDKNLGPDDTCSVEILKEWLVKDDGEPSPLRATGQREAWELAQKIILPESEGGLYLQKIEEIFEDRDVFTIMTENTYSEAAEKVKTWEESKTIKVGNIIECKKGGILGVAISCTGIVCDVMTETGDTYSLHIKDCTKTGRTLPVEDWLKQIGGEEE